MPERHRHHCRRCHNVWYAYKADPKTCARCNSPYWRDERVRPNLVCPHCGHGIRSRGGRRCPKCLKALGVEPCATEPNRNYSG